VAGEARFVQRLVARFVGRERLGDSSRCDAGVVDEHIDATSARQHLLHGLVVQIRVAGA